MPDPELQFTTQGAAPAPDVPISTISWTTVQRTSSTATLTYRIWNDLDNTLGFGNGTATNVVLFPLYQMNVGEPFLASGVEPADSQWLWVRAVMPAVGSNPVNPANRVGFDYYQWTSGWYQVGGQARFVFAANFPSYYARTIEMYLHVPGSGATQNVNSMKVALDWQRGVLSMGPFEQSREGDMTVARGDGGRYEIVRSRGMEGCRIVQMISVPSVDEVVIEQATFHKGKFSLTTSPTTIIRIPAVETDGDGVPLTPGSGDSYAILISKDPTGLGYTATKGSQEAAPGVPDVPPLPGSNYIAIGYITKVEGAAITNADITNYQHHGWGMIHWDGAGADCYVNDYLNEQGGAVQWRDSPILKTLGANDTSFVKVNGQNVVTADTVAPTEGEIYLGTVVTVGGSVTEISQRQWYNGRSSYLARKQELVDTWSLQETVQRTLGSGVPAVHNSAFLFGHMERIGNGTVDNTPTTITTTAVRGHRIAIRPHTVVAPGVLRVTGTEWDLQGTETASAYEDVIFDAVNHWMITGKRWLGTGANENGVTVRGLCRGPITCTVVGLPVAGADSLSITVNGTTTVYNFVAVVGAPTDIAVMGTVQLQAAEIVTRVTAAGLPAGIVATNPGAPSAVVSLTMGVTDWHITALASNPASIVVTEDNPWPNVDCYVYAAEPWDNCGKPFHVGTLKVKFTTLTDQATLDMRLVKFNPLVGAFDVIYNLTAPLTSMAGQVVGGGADSIINGHTYQIVLNERNATGALCDRFDRWNAPMQAIVDPWRGEGIFLELYDMKDIGMVHATLQYYTLFG